MVIFYPFRRLLSLTHTLSLHQLPRLIYYSHIPLYDFFFMLDDLIIFTLAVVALQTTIGSGYAKYGKLISGIVLVILGFTMLLTPEQLR